MLRTKLSTSEDGCDEGLDLDSRTSLGRSDICYPEYTATQEIRSVNPVLLFYLFLVKATMDYTHTSHASHALQAKE